MLAHGQPLLIKDGKMKTSRVLEILEQHDMKPCNIEKISPHKKLNVDVVAFLNNGYLLLNINKKMIKLYNPNAYNKVVSDINELKKYLKSLEEQEKFRKWGMVSKIT